MKIAVAGMADWPFADLFVEIEQAGLGGFAGARRLLGHGARVDRGRNGWRRGSGRRNRGDGGGTGNHGGFGVLTGLHR